MILGTAQFGNAYAGSRGLWKVSELRKILELAHGSGIKTLDTAFDYGVAEEHLGLADCSKFKVNTKLPSILDESVLKIREKLEKSLSRLKLSKIHTLFIHNTSNFLKHPRREEIIDFLYREKELGIIENIGVSIYNPIEIIKMENFLNFQTVQAPLNYFDDRILTFAESYKERGYNYQYRSIFLKGTLISKQQRKRSNFSQQFEIFDEAVKSQKYTNRLKFCLDYCKQITGSNNLVFGINSIVDLEEVLKLYLDAKPKPKLIRNSFIEANEKLVNPYMW